MLLLWRLNAEKAESSRARTRRDSTSIVSEIAEFQKFLQHLLQSICNTPSCAMLLDPSNYCHLLFECQVPPSLRAIQHALLRHQYSCVAELDRDLLVLCNSIFRVVNPQDTALLEAASDTYRIYWAAMTDPKNGPFGLEEMIKFHEEYPPNTYKVLEEPAPLRRPTSTELQQFPQSLPQPPDLKKTRFTRHRKCTKDLFSPEPQEAMKPRKSIKKKSFLGAIRKKLVPRRRGVAFVGTAQRKRMEEAQMLLLRPPLHPPAPSQHLQKRSASENLKAWL